MYTFHTVKELLNALAHGKELLSEMFSKRKSFDYRYDQAIEIIEEERLLFLIEKGIVTRNKNHIEIEDQLLHFFEQIFDVNEEINTSLIAEQITALRENIDYYLSEDSEYRKYKYLKIVKSSLRKLGLICLRNIVDLKRNIDNTFKTEPNYRIKIKKLENYDQRRLDIKHLIEVTEQLISEDELTFFATAKDDELSQITTELRIELQDVRHNLIEIEKQVIDFLNQVKHEGEMMKKIRRVKYLKDQFELESKSDIKEQLRADNLVMFEGRRNASMKLSLDLLHDDETYAIIKSLNRKIKTGVKAKIDLAATIDTNFFDDTVETNVFIDLEKMKNNFVASGYHLFDFVMNYDYPKPVSFEEIITCYCQMISIYEEDFKFTDQYIAHKGAEFAVVYPK